MASDEKVNGGCMCGAVRYKAIGKSVNVAYCHWTIEAQYPNNLCPKTQT